MRRVSAILVLLTTVSVMAQSAAISDGDWKKWLAEVDPLLSAGERADAKKTPAQEREKYREFFWARRNPGAADAGNPQRAEYERRVTEADKRFRDRGGWNDCGRAFVLLGKPDNVMTGLGKAHFAGDDRAQAFRDQDTAVAETWLYRNPAHLPRSPQGYNFRFTETCETLNGPAFYETLQKASESYIAAR